MCSFRYCCSLIIVVIYFVFVVFGFFGSVGIVVVKDLGFVGVIIIVR